MHPPENVQMDGTCTTVAAMRGTATTRLRPWIYGRQGLACVLREVPKNLVPAIK